MDLHVAIHMKYEGLFTSNLKERIVVSFSLWSALDSLPTLCMGQLLLCGERGYGTTTQVAA